MIDAFQPSQMTCVVSDIAPCNYGTPHLAHGLSGNIQGIQHRLAVLVGFMEPILNLPNGMSEFAMLAAIPPQ
jgi:hypothetical protein